jgi:dTDP-4-amino-4,6-dideoxygalactose transaminase
VVTNDRLLAEKIKLLRDHGRGKNNEIEMWGFNCRMDNLHAALLDLKLKKVPAWIKRRREIADLYQLGLEDLQELQLPPGPVDSGDFYDVFQNYEIECQGRDELRQFLTDHQIETMITWGGKGVHQFKKLGLSYFNLPRTERLFKRVLMLPMHPELEDKHVVYIIDCIKRFYKNRRAQNG